MTPTTAMNTKLIIDLDLCRECEECTVACSYPYHPDNNGVAWLRELAAYELVCRRCRQRSCVAACANEALEETEDALVKRYNMRCVGCMSCVSACPFGVIVPAAFLFRGTMCDYCEDREVEAPPCVPSCPKQAVTFGPVPEGKEESVTEVNARFAVRGQMWQKEEPPEEPQPEPGDKT